jgi:HEAT repeat protein
VRAVKLALRPGMDLLEPVAALLADPAAEVRRAALLAVGPAPQAVPDEGLLPCLHDPDPEVRRLCEAALAGRGLRPEHVRLGRLLTHPSPGVRAEVLDQLHSAPDLDPGVWLRRLSHDPSPAVRAAALRAMTEQTGVDLSDRVDQMARSDPSPTVCYLARLYQKRAKSSYSLRTGP